MKIRQINGISYRAKLVNMEYVGKLTDGCSPRYKNDLVSFVKIEPSNPIDIKALRSVSDYWQKWQNGNLATNIYYAACALRNKSEYYVNHEVYALTSQQTGFEKLDKDKILGLVHVCPADDSSTFIEQMQVNPEFLQEKAPEYKGIGTGILNSLKFLTEKISCYPKKIKSVTNFYLKNGFEKQFGICNLYIWQQK